MSTRHALDEYLQLAAAPLASLFLLLSLCVFVLQPRNAQGVWLELLREPYSPSCGDGRTEVLHGDPDGSWSINIDPVEAQTVAARVEELMQKRAEQALFFQPDGEMTVQNAVAMAATAQAATPDLHIGLFTRRQVVAMTRTDHGINWVPVGCMRWPR